jgi:hypothetical protein
LKSTIGDSSGYRRSHGILRLATLGLFGLRDIDRMNGLKNFCAA